MNENLTIDWPYNEVLPNNEFYTSGYMVRAFPTLYPWGNADFNNC